MMELKAQTAVKQGARQQGSEGAKEPRLEASKTAKKNGDVLQNDGVEG
jgi:hypothetical protein